MVRRKNVFISLSVIFLILGILGLGVILGMAYATHLSENEYGIVFDAGSSHTSMYLYKWNSTKTENTGEVMQMSSCKVEDGALAAHKDDPSMAGPSLKHCMDEAAKELPMFIKQYTPVYLGATAGMRVLNRDHPSASSQIFQSVRDEFESSGYQIMDVMQQAKILSGTEEGIGLWVTANYIAGTLGIALLPKWSPVLPPGVTETIGVLDLGGASTQVAFAVPSSLSLPTDDIRKLTLFSKELTVFSDSFLCYGAAEMRRQVLALLAKKHKYEGVVSHPCFADGYAVNKTYQEIFESGCTDPFVSSIVKDTTMSVVGTANNTACDNLIMEIFDQTFPNITIPTLPGRFLARGSFAYTLSDLDVLNVSKQVSYASFVTAMDDWCNKPYTEISPKKIYDPSSVCNNARYIHHLISKTYKFPDNQWSGIFFTNSLNEVDMGWTLGFMTNITSSLPRFPRLELFNITDFPFYFVLVLSIILIVIGIVAIGCACKYKRMQYQSLDVN